MIEIMRGLIAKGYAYPSGGDVYFDVSKDRDYGKLCHRDPEQMEAGARIEVSDRKRNPGEFALWKGAKPGEPQWDSPWGPGRPGWHIECSAMSMKLLGTTLDIHGGGLDLQFPHHENELAQSESFTDKTFANYWMHNGLLKMGTAKMAGSVGNVVNVVDLLKQHQPETVRFLLLSTHYRSPIEYSEERLLEVRKSLESFYRFFERYERITNESFFALEPFTHRSQFNISSRDAVDEKIGLLARWCKFEECLDDDFNTGAAIGILYDALSGLNRFADGHALEGSGRTDKRVIGPFRESVVILRSMGFLLGLFHEPVATAKGGDDRLVTGLMQLLIELRAEGRKA
jgi:cysteinyl-tRNA synthetase